MPRKTSRRPMTSETKKNGAGVKLARNLWRKLEGFLHGDDRPMHVLVASAAHLRVDEFQQYAGELLSVLNRLFVAGGRLHDGTGGSAPVGQTSRALKELRDSLCALGAENGTGSIRGSQTNEHIAHAFERVDAFFDLLRELGGDADRVVCKTLIQAHGFGGRIQQRLADASGGWIRRTVALKQADASLTGLGTQKHQRRVFRDNEAILKVSAPKNVPAEPVTPSPAAPVPALRIRLPAKLSFGTPPTAATTPSLPPLAPEDEEAAEEDAPPAKRPRRDPDVTLTALVEPSPTVDSNVDNHDGDGEEDCGEEMVVPVTAINDLVAPHWAPRFPGASCMEADLAMLDTCRWSPPIDPELFLQDIETMF